VLKSTQVGCCRVTTRRWLAEFFAALARQTQQESVIVQAGESASASLRPCTRRARRRAIAAADAELDKKRV
jgi:hypothetical protein